MKPEFTSVRYELLRPAEVRAIRERTPVVYVPAGSLEWHGKQNPLGCDALKAHGICCTAALKFGGVVLPPYYLGLLGDASWGAPGWEGYTLGYNQAPTMELAMKGVATALLSAGWKVLVGVTGHDVHGQVDAIQRGFDAALAGRKDAAAFAMMEGALHKPDDEIPLQMDHAGAWETSCMMCLAGGRVDLHELDGSPMAEQDDWGGGAEGVWGKNPVRHSTAEMGEKIVRRMADLIGQKAMGLLGKTEKQG